jgi:sugar/nucleoside kinase (ribokinase family)
MASGVMCYGELGIDNLIRVDRLPSPEIAVFPTSETYQVGGAAANSAVWLSHWGTHVRLAGNHIGKDDYGSLLVSELRRQPQLDLEHVVQQEGAVTPFCRVLVTPDGERTFLIFWYPQSQKTRLTPEMLRGCGYLALDLYGGDERVLAARLAREVGVTTVIGDVIWPDHAALPLTDFATNSAAYIRQTFAGVDVRQHARSLQRVSRGAVITTDGPHAIHVIASDESEFTVLPPRIDPLDATGAGDVLRAGLTYGLLQTWPLEECVRFGAAAGAISARQLGAASNPADVAEVLSLASSIEISPVG